MEALLNSFEKCLEDQAKGMVVTDLSNFCSNNPKQFSDSTVI